MTYAARITALPTPPCMEIEIKLAAAAIAAEADTELTALRARVGDLERAAEALLEASHHSNELQWFGADSTPWEQMRAAINKESA